MKYSHNLEIKIKNITGFSSIKKNRKMENKNKKHKLFKKIYQNKYG